MVTLKWKGDELFLGATKMAEVQLRGDTTGQRLGVAVELFRYVIGPNDHVSEPYQRKDDAKQDCMRHIRDMLAKAGA